MHETVTHKLQQRPVHLTLGLKKPLRVCALGDIHFDPIYEVDWMEHIASSLTQLKPDLIVYTGDFVTGSVRRMPDLAEILGDAEARIGSFATLGNHDHWSGVKRVTSSLEHNGIQVLRNASIRLPEEDNFYLSSLDSYWAGTPNPKILDQTPEDSRHLLLVHEPDTFLTLTNPRIKLQISGHTHGGQVRIPAIGALRLPKWGTKFQQGLYLRDDRKLYVNRGVGTLRPHIRFHCPPEITVFDLT